MFVSHVAPRNVTISRTMTLRFANVYHFKPYRIIWFKYSCTARWNYNSPTVQHSVTEQTGKAQNHCRRNANKQHSPIFPLSKCQRFAFAAFLATLLDRIPFETDSSECCRLLIGNHFEGPIFMPGKPGKADISRPGKKLLSPLLWRDGWMDDGLECKYFIPILRLLSCFHTTEIRLLFRIENEWQPVRYYFGGKC